MADSSGTSASDGYTRARLVAMEELLLQMEAAVARIDSSVRRLQINVGELESWIVRLPNLRTVFAYTAAAFTLAVALAGFTVVLIQRTGY